MISLFSHLHFIYTAHQQHPRCPGNEFRLWDKQTPYAMHPIWCATTILSETTLPAQLRYDGALALLYHDVLEDTTHSLPSRLPKRIKSLVQEMTFPGGFAEESQQLWQKSDVVKLYKLYDKVSNLLDAVWMSPELYQQYRTFTQKLCHQVEAKHGRLHIVAIFHSLPPHQSAEK